MSQKTAFLAILSLAFMVPDLAAQSDREVVTQGAEWFSANSMIKFHKRMSIYLEGNARFVQQFDPQQFQARTALDIEINKHWSIQPLGYVYTWNPLYGKQPNKYVNNEHRIFQVVTYKHKMSRISVSHRLRVEQRFMQVHAIENGDVVNEGYDNYQNRLRYRMNANIPLNKPKIEPGTLFAVVYDELFMSFGKNVTYHSPDQNRVFGGLGYAFTPHLTLQGGAFYQLLIKAGGTKQENNVGMAFTLTYNIDLTKSE